MLVKLAINNNMLGLSWLLIWMTYYMNGATMCLYIQICLLIRLNIPSQRRRGNKQMKTSKIVGFYAAQNWKNPPMVPPLDHFQGKDKNRSSFARMISASRRSFFANFATFERRSGLKIFSLLKIANLKMGCSHRSWGDAHFSLGAAQAPPN